MRSLFVASLILICIGAKPVLAAECSSVSGGTFSAASDASAKFSLAVSECAETATVALLPSVYGLATPSVAAGSAMDVSQLRQVRPAPNPGRVAIAPNYRSEYSDLVDQAGADLNIDPLLIEAMMYVESRARPGAVSHKGARGLMQVMPATARTLGHRGSVADLNDPATSISLGSAYLRKLHGMFGNDLPLVIAAYNAGEGAVKKYGRKIPPYRETQDYVKKVMARYGELRLAAYGPGAAR